MQVIKYGVIGTEALCRDLTQWDALYAAGRLQKPVLTLRESRAVTAANAANQAAALAASLLLLPRDFTAQASLTCTATGGCAAHFLLALG